MTTATRPVNSFGDRINRLIKSRRLRNYTEALEAYARRYPKDAVTLPTFIARMTRAGFTTAIVHA